MALEEIHNQAKVTSFIGSLTQEQRDRFKMNDTDSMQDTLMAIVKECIYLRKQLEN